MTSKASKLKRKRGRPRKEGVAREPNGRPSRAQDPAFTASVAIRLKKMFGQDANVSDEKLWAMAIAPKQQTYIGRLNEAYKRWEKKANDSPQPDHCLSDAQYNTAIRFQELMNQLRKVIDSEAAIYEGGGVERTEEEIAEWAERIKSRYKSCQQALNETNQKANVAMDWIVLENRTAPELVGDLRLALNALKAPLGIGD